MAVPACGGAASNADNSGAGIGTDEALGTPPTHDYEALEEASVRGTVGGTLECLWLETEDGPQELILPQGTTTRIDGDDVVVLDQDGKEVARTGDAVTVRGGYHDSESTCLEEGREDGHVLVGEIQS